MIVGRREELAILTRILSTAKSGAISLCLLTGEPGVGKTTLAEEASRMGEHEGFTVIWSRLLEETAHEPYRLWTLAARSWLELHPHSVSDQSESHKPPESLSVLLPLLPELSFIPESSPPRDHSIGHALEELVLYLARTNPTLIIIDNLHLASSECIDILSRLSRRRDGVSLAMVATSRTGEPIADLLADGKAQAVISLTNLEVGEVQSMLRQVGLGGEKELSERVYRLTSGHPLLTAELAQGLRLEGKELLDELQSDREILPTVRRFRLLFRQRFLSLSAAEREVLLFAAALASRERLRLLAAAMGRPGTRGLTGLFRRSIELGLIESVDSKTYHFPNELTREAVFDLAQAGERARIHERIGTVLEKYFGDHNLEQAGRIARHLLRGADPAAIRRGVQWALFDGGAALDRHDWGVGKIIFSRLLSEYSDFLDERQSADARFGIGRAILHSGDKQGALPHFRAAFSVYSRLDDIQRMVELALQPIALELGDVDYFAFIQAAHSRVPPGTPLYDALDYFYGVGQMEALGDYGAAWATLSELLLRSEHSGDRTAAQHCRTALSYLDVRSSRLDSAIERCELVLEGCARAEDLYARSHAEFVLMQAHLLKGEVSEAKLHAERTLEPTRLIGDHAQTCASYALLVRFALREAAWEEARRLCDEGLTLDPDNTLLLPLRVSIEYSTGHFETGDAFLDLLVSEVGDYPPGPYLVYSSTALTICGRNRAAPTSRYETLLRELVEMLLAQPLSPAVELRTLMAKGFLSLAGETPDAVSEVYEALSSRERFNLVRDYRLDHLLALLASRQGRRRPAARFFETALDDSRRIGDLPAQSWILFDYANHLSSQEGSDPPKASACYREALKIARAASMAPLVVCIDRAAAASSVIGTALPETLAVRVSGRERQVLLLLTEGMSDKEIAGTLDLSVYTVSNHVKHILAKLGATNRVAAVSTARRMGIL